MWATKYKTCVGFLYFDVIYFLRSDLEKSFNTLHFDIDSFFVFYTAWNFELTFIESKKLGIF